MTDLTEEIQKSSSSSFKSVSPRRERPQRTSVSFPGFNITKAASAATGVSNRSSSRNSASADTEGEENAMEIDAVTQPAFGPPLRQLSDSSGVYDLQLKKIADVSAATSSPLTASPSSPSPSPSRGRGGSRDSWTCGGSTGWGGQSTSPSSGRSNSDWAALSAAGVVANTRSGSDVSENDTGTKSNGCAHSDDKLKLGWAPSTCAVCIDDITGNSRWRTACMLTGGASSVLQCAKCGLTVHRACYGLGSRSPAAVAATIKAATAAVSSDESAEVNSGEDDENAVVFVVDDDDDNGGEADAAADEEVPQEYGRSKRKKQAPGTLKVMNVGVEEEEKETKILNKKQEEQQPHKYEPEEVEDGEWYCIGCSGHGSLCDVIDRAAGATRHSGRNRIRRVHMVNGHQVLSSNMYDLEEGEPSVFASEFDRDQKRKEAERAGVIRQAHMVTTATYTSINVVREALKVAMRQLGGQPCSMADLAVWMRRHADSRFGSNMIVPQVIKMALETGLAEGDFRVHQWRFGEPEAQSVTANRSKGNYESETAERSSTDYEGLMAEMEAEGPCDDDGDRATAPGKKTSVLNTTGLSADDRQAVTAVMRAISNLLEVKPFKSAGKAAGEGGGEEGPAAVRHRDDMLQSALSAFRPVNEKDPGIREVSAILKFSSFGMTTTKSRRPPEDDDDEFDDDDDGNEEDFASEEEQQEGARETSLLFVLNALTTAGVLDRYPLLTVHAGLPDSSRRIGYSIRHLFRLREEGEPPEDMTVHKVRMAAPSPLRCSSVARKLGKAANASSQARLTNDAVREKRMTNNKLLQQAAEQAANMRVKFLARYREWLRPFIARTEWEMLEAVAAKHKIKSACFNVDPTKKKGAAGPAAAGSVVGGRGDVSVPSSRAPATSAGSSQTPWMNAMYTVTDTPSYITGGTMRPHQLEGLAWMSYMDKNGCPMILGDEMGLGKTLQSIAFIAHLKYERNISGPHLIVCPLSVLGAWANEFQRWCPTLKIARLHSSDIKERERLKKEVLTDVTKWDAVVTTYEMLKGDLRTTLGSRVMWRYVVLDEGHKIKNEKSDISQVVRKVRCQSKLLLTGTPLQNNLHELWCMLEYMIPSLFKISEPFDDAFDLGANNVTVKDDVLQKAHYVLRPFILRRLKTEVEFSLPAKEVIKVRVPLTAAQMFWYKRLLLKESELLVRLDESSGKNNRGDRGGGHSKRKGGSSKGGGSSAMDVDGDNVEVEGCLTGQATGTAWQRLQSLLMQLRKCCNHPYLFPGADPEPGVTNHNIVAASGKLALLDRLLPRLKAKGHRVVLFSQFTSMLDILEDYCHMIGYRIRRLDGSVGRVQRAIAMAEYQKPKSKFFIFLMTTRAGGLGITLTAADTVILYDSDWNPQVDLQAMDRVHRIGQTKPVAVYRLMCGGTVEERIIQRAQKKMYLDSMVNRGSTSQAENMDKLGMSELVGLIKASAGVALGSSAGGGDGSCAEITEEDLDQLMDRSQYGQMKASSALKDVERKKGAAAALEVEEDVAAVDVHEDGTASGGETTVGGAVEEYNPNESLLSLRVLHGVEYKSEKLTSVKAIAAAFKKAQQQGELHSHPRDRKSRFDVIEGHTVLKINNYGLGQTLSVMDSELKHEKLKGAALYGKQWSKADAAANDKKGRLQHAGRDYPHEDTCLNCWDGGDLVLCDGCPCSYHPACLGLTHKDLAGQQRWFCPHHTCHTCDRSTGQAGGLLFRCLVCPAAYCEDHVPGEAAFIGECKRFKRLGQVHPKQAYFVYCSPQCATWARDSVLKWTGIHEESDGESDNNDDEKTDKTLPGASTAGGVNSADMIEATPATMAAARAALLATGTLVDVQSYMSMGKVCPKGTGTVVGGAVTDNKGWMDVTYDVKMVVLGGTCRKVPAQFVNVKNMVGEQPWERKEPEAPPSTLASSQKRGRGRPSKTALSLVPMEVGTEGVKRRRSAGKGSNFAVTCDDDWEIPSGNSASYSSFKQERMGEQKAMNKTRSEPALIGQRSSSSEEERRRAYNITELLDDDDA